MDLETFKQQVPLPLRVCTLVLLIRGDEVLLAMKKRDFGKGWWNGVGGKLDPGEAVLSGAVREAGEEIEVVIEEKDLEPVATIDFYFPHIPENSQRVEVFLCHQWDGEPQESDEMAPHWFPTTKLPLDDMWPGDNLWMPRVLLGQTGAGEIMFNSKSHPEPVADSKINLS